MSRAAKKAWRMNAAVSSSGFPAAQSELHPTSPSSNDVVDVMTMFSGPDIDPEKVYTFKAKDLQRMKEEFKKKVWEEGKRYGYEKGLEKGAANAKKEMEKKATIASAILKDPVPPRTSTKHCDAASQTSPPPITPAYTAPPPSKPVQPIISPPTERLSWSDDAAQLPIHPIRRNISILSSGTTKPFGTLQRRARRSREHRGPTRSIPSILSALWISDSVPPSHLPGQHHRSGRSHSSPNSGGWRSRSKFSSSSPPFHVSDDSGRALRGQWVFIPQAVG